MLPQNFHNQSNFDDVVDDDCVRGELDSDLFIPDGPVRHPVVQQWAARAQPRLCQTVHDTVLTALAAYFPYDGGWVYLTQEMIANEAGLSRQAISRPLQNLETVGLVQRARVRHEEGHRGQAFRLTGEDTNWQPVDLGFTERITVREFQLLQIINAQSERIAALEERLTEFSGEWEGNGNV